MSPYSAYERDAGISVIKSVETHCRHLTEGGSFSASSTPPLVRVEQWIDQTYYRLQAELAKEGYDVSIPASATAALGLLEQLNVYGAVMQVELAHPITSRRGEGNERYEEYATQYGEGIAILASDALEAMGATRTTALSAFVDVGGKSVSRKQVLHEDTDAVQSRFRRGFGRDPRASQPIDPGTPV